jgi:hypothetical protein
MATDFASHYLDEARRQSHGNKRLAESALAQLKDEKLFVQLDPEANSVAILVKHMGREYALALYRFLTTDGEKPNHFRD